MKRKILSRVAAVAVLSAAAGVAVAQCAPPCGTPGWTYSNYNCGPVATNSLTACQSCCRRAGISGAIPAAEVPNCMAFCAQARFVRPVGQNLWFPVVRVILFV